MFLVTELVGGETLQKYLWSIRPERIDMKLSTSLALDISQAMEHMHANGIIHRDLKPSTSFSSHLSSFHSFCIAVDLSDIEVHFGLDKFCFPFLTLLFILLGTACMKLPIVSQKE